MTGELSTPRVQPFYCPYCGEEDFVPAGPLDSADSDPGLLLGSPFSSGNVLPCQVHDCVKPCKTSGLDRATLRVPLDLPRLWVLPHKACDAVTASREKGDERRADEPARPANQNLHVRASSVWV